MFRVTGTVGQLAVSSSNSSIKILSFSLYNRHLPFHQLINHGRFSYLLDSGERINRQTQIYIYKLCIYRAKG
jgi:hypothetical protein